MTSDSSLRQRRCRVGEIGIGEDHDGPRWPGGDVLLASIAGARARHYLLTIPEAVLAGEGLTRFLTRVAPFGCPPPPSLIRAYSLPDALFPSILLKEHEEAPAGLGDAYRRFVGSPRRHWLAALQETGPGLCPVLAWQTEPMRRFLALDELTADLAETGLALPGVADGYLGRGLLLLAHPALAGSWPTRMSLGGVTKVRNITGREFPAWVDLPGHQADLLGSPLLGRVEGLLGDNNGADLGDRTGAEAGPAHPHARP
jgi:hypothetical protein